MENIQHYLDFVEIEFKEGKYFIGTATFQWQFYWLTNTTSPEVCDIIS